MRCATGHRRALLALALLLGAALGVGGCSRAPARLVPGSYRGVLALPGGELPFGLAITEQAGRPRVSLRNGAEIVAVTDIGRDATGFVLRMPGYQNRLELQPDGTGYRGAAVMVRPGGREVRLPLRVSAGERYRFPPGRAAAPAAFGGRWSIAITNAAGAVTPAIGEFTQDGAHVTGTILDPTGDHRYLEGDVDGTTLSLSRFDGGSAYLYRATLAADGTLHGQWWSGSWSVETITAHRDDGATLADPAALAAVAAPPPRLEFRFPDLDGRQVSLSDLRFRGKVVVVSLGGSWCPNCHDEAAFLLPLYREFASQGLEIVYLQFEHFGDFPAAVAANRRFVQEFAIPWPVLIAGISERDDAARKLPMLGRVFAFPTTVVLDRSGQVRKVHSGFSGPATGQHYRDFGREFTDLVRGLLAEPR